MNQLKDIRTGLKHGDISKIAIGTGYVASYVSDVLRGKVAPNENIITMATELVALNKEATKKLEKRIKQVLSR